MHQKVWNHQIPAPYSLTPAVAAQLELAQKEATPPVPYAKLEVHQETLEREPMLLDYLVVT